MKKHFTLDTLFRQPWQQYAKHVIKGLPVGILNTYLIGFTTGPLSTGVFAVGEWLRHPTNRTWNRMYEERTGEKPPKKPLHSYVIGMVSTALVAPTLFLAGDNYIEFREFLSQTAISPAEGLESLLDFSKSDKIVLGTVVHFANTIRTAYYGLSLLVDFFKSSPLKKHLSSARYDFLSFVSRGEKKEKYFKKKLTTDSDLFSYYFFMNKRGKLAEGMNFLLKERFFSAGKYDVSNELMHRRTATMLETSNSYTHFEKFFYSLLVGDNKLAKSYFGEAAELAIQEKDTSKLTASCAYQEIEEQGISADLWNKFTSLTDEKHVMTKFAEGTRGVETVKDKESPEGLLLLKKKGSLDDFILFEEQHILMEQIRSDYSNDPRIISPYSSPAISVLENNSSHMFLLRSWLPSFHDALEKLKGNSSRTLVDTYTQLKSVASSLLSQDKVDVKPLDFKEKYLGDMLLFDSNKIYDISLAQEMVNILTEASETTSTFLLDNISKNLGYSIEGGVLEIRDVENKGRATEMLNIVNHLNHSFDVLSPEDFKVTLNSLLSKFANQYMLSMEKTELIYCAALASRRDSFVRSWVKPDRTEEHPRIVPFLDHCASVFSSYDNHFARGQAAQTNMIKENLDTITARWATK